MKYYFADIENGSIENAAVLDFTDETGMKRSAVHNLVLTIENHEAQIPDGHTATALMFLAEQNGGELLTQQGKPPKDPEKYRAGRIGGATDAEQEK